MPVCRLVRRSDVAVLGGANISHAIADITAVLRLLRQGEASMPAETSVALKGPETARAYALSARVGGAYDVAGVKWTAHRPSVGDLGPKIVSMTMVNELKTGWPIGIVESALLTATRTAAVTALALRTVAPATLKRVAVLGAGDQARAHLGMLAALFAGLDEVVLWNRSPDRAARLGAAKAGWVPWPVRMAATLDQAVADADAIITCTASEQPILDAGAMQPGRIIVQVGYHEVTFDAIDRADHVVVDLWGPFKDTSAKSLFQMHRAGRFPPERVSADLCAAVLDRWRPQPGSCVYVSSFGLNVFDIALACSILRKAAAEGLGQTINLLDGIDGQDAPWP